jgi:hypothetical protein
MRRPIHLSAIAILYGALAAWGMVSLVLGALSIATSGHAPSLAFFAAILVPVFAYGLSSHWLWRLNPDARWALSFVAVMHIALLLWLVPSAVDAYKHYAFPVDGQYVVLPTSQFAKVLRDLLLEQVLLTATTTWLAWLAFRWFQRHLTPPSSGQPSAAAHIER